MTRKRPFAFQQRPWACTGARLHVMKTAGLCVLLCMGGAFQTGCSSSSSGSGGSDAGADAADAGASTTADASDGAVAQNPDDAGDDSGGTGINPPPPPGPVGWRSVVGAGGFFGQTYDDRIWTGRTAFDRTLFAVTCWGNLRGW